MPGALRYCRWSDCQGAMATAASTTESPGHGEGVTLVDPRVPRFGQAITTLGLLVAIALQAPVFVYAVAAVLLTAVGSRWRLHPYRFVWRRAVAPAVGPPAEPEPAAPHRFATVLGAVGTTLASAAILAGFPAAGYVLAGAVAVAAGLAATTGFCLGCRMYRGVSLFRRIDIV